MIRQLGKGQLAICFGENRCFADERPNLLDEKQANQGLSSCIISDMKSVGNP
jgi:hypothetical protein